MYLDGKEVSGIDVTDKDSTTCQMARFIYSKCDLTANSIVGC